MHLQKFILAYGLFWLTEGRKQCAQHPPSAAVQEPFHVGMSIIKTPLSDSLSCTRACEYLESCKATASPHDPGKRGHDGEES